MILKIFSKPINEKSYFAPFFSFSALLAAGFIAGLLIIPFAIAYVSGPFWLKLNTFREQPQVLLQQNVFGLFEGMSSTTTPLQIVYSSDPYVTQQLDLAPRVTTLKTFSVDVDADGKVDWFWINATIPLSSTETINHIRMAFSFQVTLSSRFRMVAPAMGYVDLASPLSGSGASFDGFLNIKQSDLMTDRMDYADTSSVFDYNSFFGADINAITWPRIISNYLDRSFRPQYDSIDMWNFPAAGDNFKISIKVRIPTWEVVYRPGILEVLKYGWIQYICVFLFTMPILYLSWEYIVTNQIIKTVVYQSAKAGQQKVRY